MNHEKFDYLMDEVMEYCEQNDVRAISPECGRLLKILVQTHAQNRDHTNVVEIGTGVGYSTLWMVKGLIDGGKNGRIYSIEVDSNRAEKAGHFLKKAGQIKDFAKVKEGVKVVVGDALKIIPKLNLTIDFAFIDGAKEEYHLYLKSMIPFLKCGSLVTAHNVISHQARIKKFLDEIAMFDKWDSIIIPINKAGLSLSIKKF